MFQGVADTPQAGVSTLRRWFGTVDSSQDSVAHHPRQGLLFRPQGLKMSTANQEPAQSTRRHLGASFAWQLRAVSVGGGLSFFFFSPQPVKNWWWHKGLHLPEPATFGAGFEKQGDFWSRVCLPTDSDGGDNLAIDPRASQAASEMERPTREDKGWWLDLLDLQVAGAAQLSLLRRVGHPSSCSSQSVARHRPPRWSEQSSRVWNESDKGPDVPSAYKTDPGFESFRIIYRRPRDARAGKVRRQVSRQPIPSHLSFSAYPARMTRCPFHVGEGPAPASRNWPPPPSTPGRTVLYQERPGVSCDISGGRRCPSKSHRG